MSSKKKKRPPLVNTLIMTVITVFIWIGFEVYRALTIPPPSEVSAAALLPLNPTLDSATLSELQNRVYLDDLIIGDTVILTGQDSIDVDSSDLESEESTEGGTINES